MPETPLTADDLLAPKGELESDWFAPLEPSAVSARLNEWLNAGALKAPTDYTQQQRNDVASAWAHYNAYKHISSALARKPSMLTVTEQNDTTSRTYTAQEIQHFVDLRDSWYSVFLALVPSAEVAVEHPSSLSVRARFSF